MESQESKQPDLKKEEDMARVPHCKDQGAGSPDTSSRIGESQCFQTLLPSVKGRSF